LKKPLLCISNQAKKCKIFGESEAVVVNPRILAAFFIASGWMIAMVFMACTAPPAPSVPDNPTLETNVSSRIAPEPMAPQPDAHTISSGLSVTYFRDFKARHLGDLPRGDFADQMGRPGPPVLILNHVFGKGEVFDSGEKTLIGMRMQGMIRFPQTGRYQLRAFVNDGIRLYLDGQLILDDPQWSEEGDRFTTSAVIDVRQGLWYSLTVEYFQRKGTAALQLYWQSPGSGDFQIIPSEAYAHIDPNQ
jgi:hypothetical protein